jgi:Nucleotidyl transferase AbiEii toxin, Type IV TA system
MIQPSKLPFLEYLSWQIVDPYRLSDAEMLARYERGWRYQSQVDIPGEELAWIERLALNNKSWIGSEFMDFKVNRHQIIHQILKGLNRDLLSECRAYFGGGTLISLDLGEYRTSNDIDCLGRCHERGTRSARLRFICPFGDDYSRLRRSINELTPQILLMDDSHLEISRITIDQYGIRLGIVANGVTIKTEIIAEAGFELDPPRQPNWSPVQCLSVSDCFTSKLLANADRYNDSSVRSRDLIDLAHLRLAGSIPTSAIAKSEAAYYRAMPALTDALTQFQRDLDWRFDCYEQLNISPIDRSRTIDGIDLLALDFGLSLTDRTIAESGDLGGH